MNFGIYNYIGSIYNSLDELSRVVENLRGKDGYYSINFFMTEDFNWKKFTAIFPELPDNIQVDIQGDLEDSYVYTMCFSKGRYHIYGKINAERFYLVKDAIVYFTAFPTVNINEINCCNKSKLMMGMVTKGIHIGHINAYDNSFVVSSDSRVHAFDNSLVRATDRSQVFLYDKASVEASNCEIYPLSEKVALKTQRCSICISKDSLSVMKGLYIRDRESTIVMNFPFEIETLISAGGTEIIGDDCYFDNDYNGMYRDPRKYINSDRIYYKCVYKKDNRYFSFYNKNYEYKIGELAIPDDYNANPLQSCGQGIHVATLEWALDNYFTSKNCTILEVRVPEDAKIVAPYTSNGKLRASKAEILREVSLDELGELGKFYKKFARIED